jgi:succinate dehydrogenase / fumarate reductase, cytochrome b subunit
MSWISKTLTSSIGKKLLMALTGLFLCSFLIVHMVGNLQLFKDDDGYAFNVYAVFMTSNPLIKTVSYLLYSAILFHAFWGLYLAFRNYQARGGQSYATVNNSSSWASRNMGILGTLLLVFIAVHMSNFWWEYKNDRVPYKMYVTDIQKGGFVEPPKEMPKEFSMSKRMEESLQLQQGVKITIVRDLYKEVAEDFKEELWIVILYVFSMFALAFHLYHGFQSAFQSFGFNHRKYTPAIQLLGTGVFAILIPLGFAAMPIYFHFFK